MGDTTIEWVKSDDGSKGMSWNALRAEADILRKGQTVTVSANHCEHVNEACRWCYAERGNARLGGFTFKPGHRNLYRFTVNRTTLLEPIRRRKPTRIFVESMSDAFGEWWPREFVDQLYAVMSITPHHTYINLSKRPARRLKYLADPEMPARVAKIAGDIRENDTIPGTTRDELTIRDGLEREPLQNVIEGVSVSCQEEADEFVPILLATRCHGRVVSAEPLLGPIDFTNTHGWNALTGVRMEIDGRVLPRKLDWVIVGGESGQQARPMHPNWARAIRDQCKAAGTEFFFKQWGEWLGGEVYAKANREEGAQHGLSGGFCRHQDGTENAHRGTSDHWWSGNAFGGVISSRVGKKTAKRLLDGVEHNGFPAL